MSSDHHRLLLPRDRMKQVQGPSRAMGTDCCRWSRRTEASKLLSQHSIGANLLIYAFQRAGPQPLESCSIGRVNVILCHQKAEVKETWNHQERAYYTWCQLLMSSVRQWSGVATLGPRTPGTRSCGGLLFYATNSQQRNSSMRNSSKRAYQAIPILLDIRFRCHSRLFHDLRPSLPIMPPLKLLLEALELLSKTDRICFQTRPGS